MMDNNNSLDSTSEQKIPVFVGQYVHQTKQDKVPPVVLIDLETPLTKAEKRVCDFFKCTADLAKNPVNTDNGKGEEKGKCFATRHTDIYFEMHLKEKHSSIKQFFCVYCYDSSQSESSQQILKTYPYKYLIKHMMKKHRFRRFQCNLCIYRAITEDHVMQHQKIKHSFEYWRAITAAQNTISSEERICKVLVCPKLTEQTRDLVFYWNKYKQTRLNCLGNNDTFFQCLYCTFMNELLNEVVNHCINKHPDYPILYYIPEPQVTSSSNLVELPHFSSYDKTPEVQPKLEPQDNSVSSTQKSPEAQNCSVSEKNNNSDEIRRISTEEIANNKRIRVDSTEESVSRDTITPNITLEELNVQKKRICLFCDQTFDVESDSAKNHIKTHFGNLEDDRLVLDWIQLFLNKQWPLCSFTKNDNSKSERIFYYCPLCVKLAKIHNRFAKNYKTFSDLRTHLWHHSYWLTVKCNLCKASIANCDPIIAKHFNDDRIHNPILKLKKFQFLLTNESDVKFTSEERSELEKYIEVKYNSVIDQFINDLLVKIKDDFENQLIVSCSKKTAGIEIKRLTNKKFKKYYEEYEEYNNKKKINDSQKESNKTKDYSGHNSPNNESNVSHPTVEEENFSEDSFQTASETSPTCATTSDGGGARSRLASSESRDTAYRDSDDNYGEEESEGRIACYHCNEKFKHKRDFKDHSKRVHPNAVQRMYAKPRKPNN